MKRRRRLQQNRVILANEPRLLREMLKQVLDREPAILVVGVALTETALVAAARRQRPRWVVVSLDGAGDMPAVVKTLTTRPDSPCILGLSRDGGCMKVLCAGGPVKTLQDVTLAMLIETLAGNTAAPYDASRR